MTLREIHIGFIACSVLISLFFAGWAFQQFSADYGFWYFITGMMSVLVSAGLAVYGFLFAKKAQLKDEKTF